MKMILVGWLLSLFVIICGRCGGVRNNLPSQVLEASESARQASKMFLENFRGSSQLTKLLQYIVENYLNKCDLWLLYSTGEALGSPLVAALQLYGRPVRVMVLEASERGMELPEATIAAGPACSAYIIFGQSAESLRSLVESARFESQLNYLGRFIFVTGSAAGAARLILDNPVMAWRPHALVIKKIQEVLVYPLMSFSKSITLLEDTNKPWQLRIKRIRYFHHAVEQKASSTCRSGQ